MTEQKRAQLQNEYKEITAKFAGLDKANLRAQIIGMQAEAENHLRDNMGDSHLRALYRATNGYFIANKSAPIAVLLIGAEVALAVKMIILRSEQMPTKHLMIKLGGRRSLRATLPEIFITLDKLEI